METDHDTIVEVMKRANDNIGTINLANFSSKFTGQVFYVITKQQLEELGVAITKKENGNLETT